MKTAFAPPRTEVWPGHSAGDSGHAHSFVSLLPPGSRAKSSRKEMMLVRSTLASDYADPLVTDHLCVCGSFPQCSQVSHSPSLDLSPLPILRQGSLRFPAPDPRCGCTAACALAEPEVGWRGLRRPGRQVRRPSRKWAGLCSYDAACRSNW